MHDSDDADQGRPLISYRAADMIVALLLLGGSTVVMFDSVRLGFGWQEDGPAPGFFPFYVAVALGLASLVNLAAAAKGRGGEETFVSARPFLRVLAVLVPSMIYVGLIGWIGIYAASALFILGFMLTIGKEGVIKSVLVGLFIPAALFLMFERWFLVPLPKGPIEALLGF
ncbi:MAG: tripartite tricarboxylate transporter TctB family protein [Hyphomicrobiaceae bacterium]|nr:tripartite tricarboxylate transporter TctB family protein [Hyphomicrobiaceae bacterium]